MIFECVINVSEGRSPDSISLIRESGGKPVVDVHSDPDHNRSVFTLASRSLLEIENSARELTKKAHTTLTITKHCGVHPRFGVVDVVPFVSYNQLHNTPSVETIEAAIKFGEWANSQFDIPIFFYDYASPNMVTLPNLRKNMGAKIFPSIPNRAVTKSADVICVGARPPLVAINVNLKTQDLSLAKTIAAEIRESSGGFRGIRAIGLQLIEQKMVQVSMNIVDLENASTELVCNMVATKATDANVESSVELVGLVPKFHFDTWSDEFLGYSGLTSSCTVESRL